MNRMFLATLFISQLPNLNWAQENKNSEKVKKIQVENLSVFYTEGSERISRGTLEDFRSLAPNSEILDDDLSGFNMYTQPGGGLVRTYSVNAGFKFTDQEKNKLRKNSEIRFGVNFSRHINLGNTFDKYVLSDPQSSPDTNVYYNYSMSNTSKQVQIDMSYLYNILPEARFSFYFGLGLQPGLHYNNVTRIMNNIHTYSSSYTSPNDEYYWDNGKRLSRGEVFKNKAGFSLSANVPIGMDIKLSKKDPFLRSVHLFLEARPSVKMLFLPSISPIAYAHLNIGGGIRFCRN